VWDLSVALLREFAYGWHTNEIAVSLLFAFLIAFADQIISLPFALYSTFIIESKHGFNKQTLATFFMDTLKGLLLSTVLGAPILAALITIVRMGGDYFFVAAWAFIFVVSLFLMTIYPTFIAPLFNKFSPLEDGALKVRAALRTKLHPLKSLVVSDRHSRAC
jgi:STE24 endopeptidase